MARSLWVWVLLRVLDSPELGCSGACVWQLGLSLGGSRDSTGPAAAPFGPDTDTPCPILLNTEGSHLVCGLNGVACMVLRDLRQVISLTQSSLGLLLFLLRAVAGTTQ